MKNTILASLLTLLLLAGCSNPNTSGSETSIPTSTSPPPTSSEIMSEICLAPTIEFVQYEKDYANMAIYLSEDWLFETEDPSEDSPSFGINFWPKADPDFVARLHFYPDFFGICGTGVTFEELQLQNGLKATLCRERMQNDAFWAVIFFNDLPGSYNLQIETTYSLWETYRSELISILANADLAEGIISMSDAIRIAAEHIPDADPDSLTATFSYSDGTWGVENSDYFLVLSAQGELLEIHMDPK